MSEGLAPVIVVESIIVVVSVIGLLWCGVFIGREFGSFERFVMWFLEYWRTKLYTDDTSYKEQIIDKDDNLHITRP